MKIRSRAPLRLGLAGGGTDVSPYCDEFGGCVLNATIKMYANVTLEEIKDEGKVIFIAKDLEIIEEITFNEIENPNTLMLHKAVYKRVMDDYNQGKYIPLKITSYSDAPVGSGLGSSSTMVVALLEALRQYLQLPFGEYDLAHLAYEIERKDCMLAGGKQDQYAATFGGFNFIEFFANDRVIVNPLRIRKYIINELEASLILFYTGASRSSAKIIEDQKESLKSSNSKRLDAMHQIKNSCFKIKEHLFKADIESVSKEFKSSWLSKKATSNSISNSLIDEIDDRVMEAGAKSLKVSGAGGGGFVMIFVDSEQKPEIIKVLRNFDGKVFPVHFTSEGVISWTI